MLAHIVAGDVRERRREMSVRSVLRNRPLIARKKLRTLTPWWT